MMEPLSIPAIQTLKSTDAIAIRQIVSALIQAVDSLRKDVEELKKRPIPGKDTRYKGNF